MARPTCKQISYVHLLQNKLGWSDDEYHSRLYQRFKVRSCTKLTPIQIQALIDSMLAALGDSFKPTPKVQPNNKIGTERLTEPQCMKIVNLWWSVSRGQTDQEKRIGLRAFVKRQTGCDALKFVPRAYAPKLICALETMSRNLKKSNKEAIING